MFLQLFLGGVLIGVNVFFHALALDVIIRHTGSSNKWLKKHMRLGGKAILSAGVVLAVFCSHIVQIWIWAAVYYCLPGVDLPDFHTALYFSTSTMTTLGFGDYVLPAPWNLFSAIESANGIIAFGWSTAFIFEEISQIYRHEANSIN